MKGLCLSRLDGHLPRDPGAQQCTPKHGTGLCHLTSVHSECILQHPPGWEIQLDELLAFTSPQYTDPAHKTCMTRATSNKVNTRALPSVFTLGKPVTSSFKGDILLW